MNTDSRDALTHYVPAIIALAMVAAVIYLAVWTTKETPTFLVNSLTTILGYYFGIGVSGNRQVAPVNTKQLSDPSADKKV